MPIQLPNQPPKVATVLDAFPHVASRAIYSRISPGGGEPDLIFAGSGSGLLVLQVDGAGVPTLYGTPEEARIDVGGVVLGIAVSEEYVYLAAKRAGLVRLKRIESGTSQPDTWVVDFKFALPLNLPDDADEAFDLVVWRDVNNNARVLVGTATDGVGHLYLFDPDPATGPVLLHDLAAPGEVWSLAHAEGLIGNEITVLLGTACAGLHRLQFAVGAIAIPGPSASLASLPFRFMRGIAIHNGGTDQMRAFVAEHFHGVRIVNLNGGGLGTIAVVHPQVSTGLPKHTYALGLDFDPIESRLVVALGPEFGGELQYGSSNRVPDPCTVIPGQLSQPKAEEKGIVAYEFANDALTLENGFILEIDTLENQPILAIQASIRRVTSAKYFVDIAGDGTGVQTIQVLFSGSTWDFTRTGAFDQLDGIVLAGPDEVLFQESTLYGSGEHCLATFDRSGSNPPSLLLPASIVKAIPVNTLTGFPEPNARVYSSGLEGTLFWDVSGPNRLLPVKGQGLMLKKGRGQAIQRAFGPLVIGPDGEPHWRLLVEINLLHDEAEAEKTGGLRVFRVGTATSPDDTTKVKRLGTWRHAGTDPQGNPLPSSELGRMDSDITAPLPAGLGAFAYWYISFGPGRPNPSQLAGTHAGLLVLKVGFQGATPQIELVDRIPVATAEEGEHVFNVTVDLPRQRVYAALGTAGVAVFSIAGDLAHPVLLGYRSFVSGSDVATCYRCLGCYDGKLLVSYLQRGLLLIDNPDQIATSPARFYKTRFQAVDIHQDPTDATLHTFYVADGRGGYLRVYLPGE